MIITSNCKWQDEWVLERVNAVRSNNSASTSHSRVFAASTYESFSYPRTRLCGSLQRPADVQGGHRQTTPRQPDWRKLYTLFPQPGPHHSRDYRDLSRVQSVSFDHRVTVYLSDDYYRTSFWMYIARRRQHFRLRIQQMELNLTPTLDDVHRFKIRMRHLAFCRYCVWQCELDYMYICLLYTSPSPRD